MYTGTYVLFIKVHDDMMNNIYDELILLSLKYLRHIDSFNSFQYCKCWKISIVRWYMYTRYIVLPQFTFLFAIMPPTSIEGY